MKTEAFSAIWKLALALCLLAIGASALWVAYSVAQPRQNLQAAEDRATGSLQAAAETLERGRKDLASAESQIVRQTGNATAQIAHDLSVSIKHTDESLNGKRGVLPAAAATVASLSPVGPAAVSALTETSETEKILRASATAAMGNIAAMVTDGQDSLDDLYPDLRALVESATVTTTSAAQVSQEIRRVAPSVATDASKTASNVRRITNWPMVLGRAVISGVCRLKFW